MKHVRTVTRGLPLKAYWWQWLGPAGSIKGVGKPALDSILGTLTGQGLRGPFLATNIRLWPDL